MLMGIQITGNYKFGALPYVKGYAAHASFALLSHGLPLPLLQVLSDLKDAGAQGWVYWQVMQNHIAFDLHQTAELCLFKHLNLAQQLH